MMPGSMPSDAIRDAVEAPAKINLSLAVRGRRPDGFHDIESWVVRINWCDRLEFESADELQLEVVGGGTAIPADHRNLVWRAAANLAAAAGRAPDARIRLYKEVPSGAGLGGGSSDAAATLLALNRRWGLDWPAERLATIAAELGSDVPLFLHGGPLMISGRGEHVEPLAMAWRGVALLIVPAYSLATGDVYLAWGKSGALERPRTPAPRFASRRAVDLLPSLFNDLERPAFALNPELGRLRDSVERILARPVRMTGSGSTLFTLFDHPDEAGQLAEQLAARLTPGTRLHVAGLRDD